MCESCYFAHYIIRRLDLWLLYHSSAGFLEYICAYYLTHWIHCDYNITHWLDRLDTFVSIVSPIGWITWIHLCLLCHPLAGLLGHICPYYITHCLDCLDTFVPISLSARGTYRSQKKLEFAGLLGHLCAYYITQCTRNIPVPEEIGICWRRTDIVRIARAANPSSKDGRCRSSVYHGPE